MDETKEQILKVLEDDITYYEIDDKWGSSGTEALAYIIKIIKGEII